jgi:hypothetical protein
VSAAPAILRDVRFAIKSLGRSPGFTLIAIITLGLGIGANTSMFSILNDYMWRPTPYADRDRLDRIYRATRQDPRGSISPADYLDLIHGSPRPQLLAAPAITLRAASASQRRSNASVPTERTSWTPPRLDPRPIQWVHERRSPAPRAIIEWPALDGRVGPLKNREGFVKNC